MNAQLIRRLLRQNSVWFLLIPVVAAMTAFYFTRNQTRIYRSTATLYTGLASGYSILTDERNPRVDHQAVENAFQNLLSTVGSRETMTQVGIRLLARHLLLERPDSLILANRGFQQLQKNIPATVRATLTAGRDEQVVYRRIDSMAHSVRGNPVKNLLISPTSWYGTTKIAKDLKATRKKDSDMLELSYESEDAGVTYATLTELISVFSERYAGFKSSETNPVVRYYTNQNRQAIQRLQQAELKMKDFEETNNIINYEEESKDIADTKEEILNQYNEELMKSRAAKASLETITKRLEDRLTVLKTNEELLSKRTELAAVTGQLAQAQVYGRSKETVGQLAAKAAQVSEELKLAALKYYRVGNTVESLPQTHLLDEWLDKLLQEEESTARLSAYEKRLGEFNSMAAKFTPLGSTLTQLKRDIGVAEKNYLTTLNALNQAQTRQKNAEMAGPIRLLDAPEFPVQPLPSKRIMLVGAAFGVGVVLALMLLLIRYMTDNRLYEPGRFEQLTGLPVVASFPTVHRRANRKIRIMMQYMLEQLRSTVAVDMLPVPTYRSYALISVWSTRPKQGKTWLTTQLAERYGLAGKRVAYLYPHPISNSLSLPDDVTPIAYTIRGDFAYAKRIEQIVDDRHLFDPDQYDIILLELPDLSETPIATYLVAQSNLLLLAVSARGTWNSTDQNLYQLYRKATLAPILPVLNHVASGLIRVTGSAESRSAVSPNAVQPVPAVAAKKETV